MSKSREFIDGYNSKIEELTKKHGLPEWALKYAVSDETLEIELLNPKSLLRDESVSFENFQVTNCGKGRIVLDCVNVSYCLDSPESTGYETWTLNTNNDIRLIQIGVHIAAVHKDGNLIVVATRSMETTD